MRPTFHPFLVNDPYHDPCLFINFLFENRAIAFDLGDLHALSAKNILKISHVFVTHTHMDHFVGFDALLRLTLGRDKTIDLFGPENFLKNVEGKLAGYTWNLTTNYRDSLTLRVTEIRRDKMLTQMYHCRKQFRPEKPPAVRPVTDILLDEPGFSVSFVQLSHDTACLGFCLNERFHININTEGLAALGLEPGPWINDFKTALYENAPPDSEITVMTDGGVKRFPLGDLSEKIALITPGQKITYIADINYQPDNIDQIIAFAKDSDHLFIESHFLDADKDLARRKHHLTATQAGTLAGKAGVKRLTTFHYSPRYEDQQAMLENEAQAAYQMALGKEEK